MPRPLSILISLISGMPTEASVRDGRGKNNRTLKKRIALITQKAQTYVKEPQRQNWSSFCDQLQGTLHTKRTWPLLRSLLDHINTRWYTDHKKQRLLKNSDRPLQCFLELAKHHLFGHPSFGPPTRVSHYTGSNNEGLYDPFTLTKLTAVLAPLTRNTTPGKDKITCRILRNLDEEILPELLTLFSPHWQAGILPADWRHSDITLIRKPNEPFTPTALRPVSLTSSLVKLLEHRMHHRLSEHLEKLNLYPLTMFGFRLHLSTQDVLIQIKEEVLDHLSRTTTKTILTLDVKGAFHNITHQAILDNLKEP